MRHALALALSLATAGCATPHADEPVWVGFVFDGNGCAVNGLHVHWTSLTLEECIAGGDEVFGYVESRWPREWAAYQCVRDCVAEHGEQLSCPNRFGPGWPEPLIDVRLACADAVDVIGSPPYDTIRRR